MLWLMLFINITCGIALISAAAPLAQKSTGMSATTAATMVAIMGLFNGGGRFVWASISDYIGRSNVFTTFFTINVVAFIGLYFTHSPLLFDILLFLIITCYGGGFSAVPAYISDIFDSRAVAAIHGYVLTAWALAGMVGPILLSTITAASGSYATAMIIFSILSGIALILSITIRHEITKSTK